ncbi:MAG: hypothetical protein NZR01_11170 [Bryobacteraceae bacterium]|nr:hypothetical protein [Bryobacteraceae bacterium]
MNQASANPAAQALDLLLARQNPDGGFGHAAGQSSWVEPTAWAALALHGRPQASRAMAWLAGQQMPGGGWPAHPQTQRESWVTSLVVLLKCIRGEFDEGWQRGMHWLLGHPARPGPTPSWLDRLLRREPAVVQDHQLLGWPWTPGTSGWIEPTVHAVRALQLCRPAAGNPAVQERIGHGIRMILDRQCRDGGWNYGNKRVLGEDLESFPECTALALIGLAGRGGPPVERGIACAFQHWSRQPRGLAQALLRIAFRMHGAAFDDRPVRVTARTETSVLALALIGEPQGTWKLWQGGNAS